MNKFILLLTAMLLILLISVTIVDKKELNNHHKYYLNIPDSPKVENPWLEIDYISNDTCYLGWYWRVDSLSLRSYQIQCTQDSMIIYDFNRRVAATPYDSSQISGIILQDNK